MAKVREIKGKWNITEMEKTIKIAGERKQVQEYAGRGQMWPTFHSLDTPDLGPSLYIFC